MEVLAALAILGLAVSSAFFSGMETALFSIKAWHLGRWRELDPQAADRYQKLMRDPRSVLNAIFFVATLINIVLTVGSFALVSSLEMPIPNWAKILGLFAIIVLACDLLPKAYALADPFRFADFSVSVLAGLLPVTEPISRLLERSVEKTVGRLLPKTGELRDHLSDDELLTLVELSEEEGHLSQDESEMIEAIIKLGNKTVKDCMTPRVDAFLIPDNLPNEEVIRELRLQRVGRVPVYGDSPDEILGVLDARTFLLDSTEHYTERVEPPSFVPETMRAMELLRAFLTHPQRLAIVVDEFGGTAGLCTFSDIVEEILADVAPRPDEALYLEKEGDGVWVASGGARLDDLAEELGVEFPPDGIDTINGLIFNRLGFVPKPGSIIEIPPLAYHVRQSNRKRVVEVSIQPIAAETSKEAE